MHFSRYFKRQTQSLTFPVVKGFIIKNESLKFYAAESIVHKLPPNSEEDKRLCPFQAMYDLHLRRKEFSRMDRDSLKHFFVDFKSHKALTITRARLLIAQIIQLSRLEEGFTDKVSMGPHGFRKLAASYSVQAGHSEQAIIHNMGFSSLTVFSRNYVFDVEPLEYNCVVPGGVYNKLL